MIFPFIRDSLFQHMSIYKGYDVITYFSLLRGPPYNEALYKGFPFIMDFPLRDFPLYEISMYKGFCYINDFPL